MTGPVVSVIIATYRRNELLLETIQSVLAQTARDIEIMVIDDAGDPETAAAIMQMKSDHAALRYVKRSEHTDRAGGLPSRNVGTQLSRGRFVLFLDDDDLLAPTCLENRVSVLEANPDLDYCVGQCTLFDGAPKPNDPLWREWAVDQDDILMFLSNKVPWQTTGPLWRRNALERIGGWDESLASGHDYEFHARALAMGAVGWRIPVVDYHWRRPRADSFSGFDAFKRQYRDGAHVVAFCKALDSIGQHNRWTMPRRDAAWREAVRLAVVCRLYGGSRQAAQPALNSARRWGCGTVGTYLEVTACIAGWTQIFGRIPAMTYLNRRGFIGT
jgi:glycosyltransferase involved in cell wall biosynthesis